MRALIAWTLKWWLWLALATSAAMLAIAHGFQTFGHLAPCELCLKQRTVYWVALGGCAVAIALRANRPTRRSVAPLVGLILALVFAAGCGIAVYQAGAEWKWWPGPDSCSGAALNAGGDRPESLPERRQGACGALRRGVLAVPGPVHGGLERADLAEAGGLEPGLGRLEPPS